jgi:DNA-binding transcriptional LysR family regulator
MDRLRLIKTFVAVAQARSFTTAAEGLRISRTNVTKQVAALEALLQRKLFNRTTHAVNLTEAGSTLLEHGEAMLGAFEALETRVRQSSSSPRGVIRIGTPPSFGALQLIPAIRAFKPAHPDIEVALFNDDGAVDLIRTGLDFTIRIADSLRDTSAISRLLVRVPQVLVAAPEYLNVHGTPVTPDDLLQHNCLVHVGKAPTSIWRFRRGSEQFRVQVSGSMSSNFGEAIRSAALLGDGIAMHPTYMIDEDLRAGRLQIVMGGYDPTGLEIRAVYARKELPARVGLFLSFLRTWLRHETRWPQSSSDIDRYGSATSQK